MAGLTAYNSEKLTCGYQCGCPLCKFGRKLSDLADKYKMSEEDKSFLLNEVFMKAEYLEMAKYDLQHKSK
jgi:hypothetical protein